MPDFKHFQVKKLSEQAMSKLRRGLPARLMEGTGTQLCVLPHQYDAISKSFLKKKGINVSLSPPEIAENQTIDGGSIFGKRIDKALEKKQGLKSFLYNAGTALKPIAQVWGGLCNKYGSSVCCYRFSKRHGNAVHERPIFVTK